MPLTRSRFEQKFKDNKLRLAFIGMSNIGKSFRSKELSNDKDFVISSIDEGICEKINIKEEKDLGEWFGYPYEKDFSLKQKKYLEIEDSLTKGVQIPQNENFILDTTGSVIYLPEVTHKFLKDNFFIIHFEVPSENIKKMIEEYCAEPKSVVWGDIFNQKENESDAEALKRCYPELLAFRTEKYRALADISINFFREDPMTNEEFLQSLKSSLK